MSALPTVEEIQACMEANHTCPAIAYFMLTQHLDYPAALAYYREHFHEYDLTEEEEEEVTDSEGRLNLVIMRSLNVDKATAALLRSVPYEHPCYYPTDEESLAYNPVPELGRIMLMNNMTRKQAWQRFAGQFLIGCFRTYLPVLRDVKKKAFGPYLIDPMVIGIEDSTDLNQEVVLRILI